MAMSASAVAPVSSERLADHFLRDRQRPAVHACAVYMSMVTTLPGRSSLVTLEDAQLALFEVLALLEEEDALTASLT